jgi:tetratricopeptide (TPR) repeat protein
VHPLNTQAVSYIVQRCESMMGLFFLLTLYCTVRGAMSKNVVWYVLAVIACALGMGTKEVMIVAPVVVLLYDRAFIAGSFGQAIKRRWPLYAAMFLPLAAALVLALRFVFSGSTTQTLGFSIEKLTWHEYLVTQFGVILHYLKLTFAPWRFSLDYQDWPITRSVGVILLTGIPIALMLAVSLYGLVRNKWWGFLGTAFFVILAPSSSILPINDLVMEHRMYLPLVAVLVLVVFLVDALLRRLATADADTARARVIVSIVLVSAVGLWLSITTFVRNQDYRSDVDMYETVLDVRPNNTRAMRNAASALGNRFQRDGDIEDIRRAAAHLTEYLMRKPDDLEAQLALGRMFMDLKQTDKAIAVFADVLKMDKVDADAYYQVGWGYFNAKMFPQAEVQLRKAKELNPTDPKLISDINMMLARTLVATDRPVEAEALMADVLKRNPELANVWVEFGLLKLDLNKPAEAFEAFGNALKAQPDNLEGLTNVGAMFLNAQQSGEAIKYLTIAMKIARDRGVGPDSFKQIFSNMGKAYALRNGPGDPGQPSDMMSAYLMFQNIVMMDQNDAEAWSDMGNVLRLGGQAKAAVAAMRKSVELNPTSPEALRRLAWTLATTWDPEQIDGSAAVNFATRANQAMGDRHATYIHTLAVAYARVGDFEKAIATAQRAHEIAVTGNNPSYAAEIQKHIDLFKTNQPFTETQPPKIPIE